MLRTGNLQLDFVVNAAIVDNLVPDNKSRYRNFGVRKSESDYTDDNITTYESLDEEISESTNEETLPIPEPITEIVTVTKDIVTALNTSKYIGEFTITGYCPCEICCQMYSAPALGKTTAIEVGAYEGVTVAVDPSVIAYGTKVFIEGYGVRIASDRGGAIKNKRLDIYFATHEAACDVAVQTGIKVWLIVE